MCGDAEVWGDFIVPRPCAHLDGALNLDLEGVFHSPLGEKLPFFGPWYGSPEVLPRWLQHAVPGAELPQQVEAQVAAAAASEGGGLAA